MLVIYSMILIVISYYSRIFICAISETLIVNLPKGCRTPTLTNLVFNFLNMVLLCFVDNKVCIVTDVEVIIIYNVVYMPSFYI